ncbi:hypothetical protein PIB30_014335 [Stylosanthes scabra]|uniref:Uncharacterized protein n=1 Tax=Stylosanthes scabra TaxID=79078 RepID=A0ABU6R6Q3_9FABA|nr:hypothetical protein [Stylosanthes scabra]
MGGPIHVYIAICNSVIMKLLIDSEAEEVELLLALSIHLVFVVPFVCYLYMLDLNAARIHCAVETYEDLRKIVRKNDACDCCEDGDSRHRFWQRLEERLTVVAGGFGGLRKTAPVTAAKSEVHGTDSGRDSKRG